jgi:hypothetical protein
VNGPGTVILMVRSVLARRNLHVVDLDRMPAPHLAGDARHRIGMAGAVERGAGIVDVDAFERGREAVGIALAPHLAVGDDVEAGALLIADGEQRRVVLRLRQEFRRYAPQFLGAHPRRKAAGELLAIDQPFRLGVGADQRCRQQRQGRSHDAGTSVARGWRQVMARSRSATAHPDRSVARRTTGQRPPC